MAELVSRTILPPTARIVGLEDCKAEHRTDGKPPQGCCMRGAPWILQAPVNFDPSPRDGAECYSKRNAAEVCGRHNLALHPEPSICIM
jgi:hypothetical protein